jgi:Sap-like sulfolipid-1-addressing protein
VAEIFGLAIAAAFYPVLLAAVLLILTRPQPRGLLLAFLLGGMAISLLAGTLILVLAQDSGALSGSSRRTVSPAVDIAVGVLSLVVAVVLWRRRDRPRKERTQPQWLSRRLGGASAWPVFVIGVVLNLPGVYYLAALKQISAGGYGTATDAFLLVAFNLIMFALVEVPLVWYVASPDGARRRVEALDAWFHAHATELGVAIAAVVGAYLCAKGLRGALS